MSDWLHIENHEIVLWRLLYFHLFQFIHQTHRLISQTIMSISTADSLLLVLFSPLLFHSLSLFLWLFAACSFVRVFVCLFVLECLFTCLLVSCLSVCFCRSLVFLRCCGGSGGWLFVCWLKFRDLLPPPPPPTPSLSPLPTPNPPFESEMKA